MFELKDKETSVPITIYSVRSVKDRTEFLIYDDEYGFVWNDSSYFEPINKNDLYAIGKMLFNQHPNT